MSTGATMTDFNRLELRDLADEIDRMRSYLADLSAPPQD